MLKENRVQITTGKNTLCTSGMGYMQIWINSFATLKLVPITYQQIKKQS